MVYILYWLSVPDKTPYGIAMKSWQPQVVALASRLLQVWSIIVWRRRPFTLRSKKGFERTMTNPPRSAPVCSDVQHAKPGAGA